MSSLSTHGRGACFVQLARGERVPVTAIVLPSFATTTNMRPGGTLRVTIAPPSALLSALAWLPPPPPPPPPPKPPPPRDSVTPRPRLKRLLSERRTANTVLLSDAKSSLPPALNTGAPSCGPPSYSTLVSFGPKGGTQLTILTLVGWRR